MNLRNYTLIEIGRDRHEEIKKIAKEQGKPVREIADFIFKNFIETFQKNTLTQVN
ncbi:MAG TPA: hypothetical protein PL110_06395 [Candidatus Eremiobacteraeota bacterium]|nr:hypothetical protein [Candidatus Eremiobacteraeota bacterium]